ncbi:MAG: putative aminoglycoside phosphotransferase [Frankiales bacterium]|nr:putative aminoglycoside phosphotransferase [Frankiales bacterium]
MTDAPGAGLTRAGDEPRELRAEDAFDVAAVHAWLSQRVAGLGGPPLVRQFGGGASNLTYLLEYADQELVLRRPPAGAKAASAHDMRREHRVQDSLRPHYPYVPRMVAFCDDAAVLGSDFYVMERLRGTILRGRLPRGTSLTKEQAAALGRHAVDSLVALHQVDAAAAGLSDLGRGPGYVGRQVAGWSGRYRQARTDDVPDFTAVMAWLDRHQPADVAMCLIHNDFRLDNLVLGEDLQVIGVLDWEMATLGDPLMDLASALAYWVQADDDEVMLLSKRQPTDLPGMPTRAEVVEHYTSATGLALHSWTFYEVFGLFRLAGIVQQIYLRYVRGQTTNPAFQHYGHFVAYLESRCSSLIARS